MKKLALVILAGISLATANAQFQLGIKGGVNFSNVNGSDVSGTSSLTGYNVGAWFKLPLARHIALQPELIYSAEGYQISESGVTNNQHNDYVNIPVLLKFTHFSGLFAETGPQLGFLTSANAKADGQTANDKAYFNSANFSWVFGVGFHIPTTPVSIDARYNLGISNIANNNDDSGGDNPSIHSGSFQVGLMVTLFKAPVR